MNWISVKDRLPEIKEMNSRTELPLYVKSRINKITIADYSKSKFKNGQEWVSNNYDPIWICRARGEDFSDKEIHPTHWKESPNP